MSLGDFHGVEVVAGSVTVTKKISSNWADDCEEEDEYNKRIQVISLPTAPRASRILSEDSVPQSPPFLAYLSNLPYDIQENDLYDFFANMTLTSVRLPKDDIENRSRGFGYVEFETRNELIEAVSIPDPSIRNRRIRIDVSTESDQKRNGGGGNWRGRNDDRGGEGGEGGNRRGFSFRDRERDGEVDNGDWRSSARPKLASPPPQRRGGFGDNFNKERSDRSDRSERPDRSYGRSRGGFEDRPNRRDDQPPMERPKLNLTKRTLPIEEIVPADEEIEQEPEVPKPKPVPAAAIFGEAKPVDTSAREREIEERNEKLRLAKLKEAEERKEKEKLEKELKEQEKEAEETNDSEKTDEKEKEPEKKEEIISWRNKKEDDKSDSDRKRTQSPPRRTFSPSRRNDNMRRNDDRRGGGGGGGGGQRENRPFRENRDRDFKDRNDRPKDGHFRDRDQRDNRTDYNR